MVMYEKVKLYMKTEEMIVQLMCDEMKLVGDILLNTKNNIVVGFTSDFVSMKKIVTNILDKESVSNFCQPAVNVNQWRYHLVNGKTYSVSFWFNTGKLVGEELLCQFMEVVMQCKHVGMRVLGMTCDAGSNNSRLFRKLRGNSALPDGSWLPVEYV